MVEFGFSPEGTHFLVDVQVSDEDPDELVFLFYCGVMRLFVMSAEEQGMMMALKNHWVSVRRSSPNSFAFRLLEGPEG